MIDSQLQDNSLYDYIRAKVHDRLAYTVVLITTLILCVALWLQLGTLAWPPSASFELPRFSVEASGADGQCRSESAGKSSKVGHTNDGSMFFSESDDEELEHSGKRTFRAHGYATRTFVEFGAYRSSASEFSIVGLASKALHDFGSPSFSCEWFPASPGGENGGLFPDTPVVLYGTATKDLPDYGYGRTYSVVVVTCTFDSDVGTDSMGGSLVLNAYKEALQDHDQDASSAKERERFVVMREKPGDYNETKMRPPYLYEFVYCGSPLYGNVNPCRVREWMAYHDRVFGERSHFVFYDAGGIHDAVRRVLEPWSRRGRVSIQDVRSQAFWDGYYYNQFLMNNDCVQRSKFLANWTIFFDLDEYLYVEPPTTFHQLMEERESSVTAAAGRPPVTQVGFSKYHMATDVCLDDSGREVQPPVTSVRLHAFNCTQLWSFGNLIYREISHPSFEGMKYICNPRRVYANGVHSTYRVVPDGILETFNESVAIFYHYHGTVVREDAYNGSTSNLCRKFSKVRTRDQVISGSLGNPLMYDDAMLPIASRLSTLFHEEEGLPP